MERSKGKNTKIGYNTIIIDSEKWRLDISTEGLYKAIKKIIKLKETHKDQQRSDDHGWNQIKWWKIELVGIIQESFKKLQGRRYEIKISGMSKQSTTSK